jgi:hypothetical protein
MSTQINQYLMWATRLPYEGMKEWEKQHEKDFYDSFEDFMEDSAFSSEVEHKDGIFCLFDGMNGQYIFIGKVLAKSKEGSFLGDSILAIKKPAVREQSIIRNSVLRNFEVEGKFDLYLITHYR